MTNYYHEVYIDSKFSLLTSDKYNPIVKENVDLFINDYYMKKKSIEEAESEYQLLTINKMLVKNNIDLLISSDLQNQNLASVLAASNKNISFLGIYNACASFCEALIIGSNFIENKKQNVLVTVSGHNLVTEKQFRYPVEYGAIRKMVNGCTCSGSISVLLNNNKSKYKIESSTVGSVIMMNHKDANDMGSAMAPAAAETLYKHLSDTNREIDYYDLILTGDLGEYGSLIFKKYYYKKYKKKIINHIDAGEIFYCENNIFTGASGPLCLPIVFFDYILKENKYKKILLLATGSLHSVTSTNLGLNIPSISHAVSVEVLL